MGNKNIYLEKINEIYEELETYTNVFRQINSGRDSKARELYDIYEKNKDSEEIKEFAFDSFFVASFQNIDLQIIRSKFVSYVELYLFDKDAEPLSDEIFKSYEYYKNILPKRMFLVKNGKLEEMEDGSIKSKKKRFEEQNLFSMVENQVKQVMNNVREDR